MAPSRPRVTLCAGMSIDGKVASISGDSGLSSEVDLSRLHRLRASADAVLVGANTVRRDDPLLTVRRARGSNPIRVILDSRGLIPDDSKILQTARAVPTIIAVSGSASASNVRRLLKKTTVIRTGRTRSSLPVLLKKLAARGIKSVLVEGGGTVHWEFVKLGLWDELVVTIAPVILGGDGATPLVRGGGFASVAGAAHARLERVRKSGGEVVLYYTRP